MTGRWWHLDSNTHTVRFPVASRTHSLRRGTSWESDTAHFHNLMTSGLVRLRELHAPWTRVNQCKSFLTTPTESALDQRRGTQSGISFSVSAGGVRNCSIPFCSLGPCLLLSRDSSSLRQHTWASDITVQWPIHSQDTLSVSEPLYPPLLSIHV